jgi:hypothetical protein
MCVANIKIWEIFENFFCRDRSLPVPTKKYKKSGIIWDILYADLTNLAISKELVFISNNDFITRKAIRFVADKQTSPNKAVGVKYVTAT